MDSFEEPTRNFDRAVDHNGDVIFEVKQSQSEQTTSFLVSRKVVCLASRYFAAMFKPVFKEGRQAVSEERTTIMLDGDDASIMEIIFKILHHCYEGLPETMDAKRLACLTLHCDKYDVINAIGPWIWRWYSNMGSITKLNEELGYLILVGFFLGNENIFTKISQRAIKELAPGFVSEWNENDTLAILPEAIADTILAEITQASSRLLSQLHSTEGLLREYPKIYTTKNQLCTNCGRPLPQEAKNCRPCHTQDLVPNYCTIDTRISAYFKELRAVELWPSTLPFERLSVSQLIERFDSTKLCVSHSCKAQANCPLFTGLEELRRKTGQIGERIRGLNLSSIKAKIGGEVVL